ncbi:hypothetical protein, partial [Priestia megaterium]|uniref:hypothetical protein n=1 Tax=Priestia megaterium TaxID=1404 RepID=UPI0030092033
ASDYLLFIQPDNIFLFGNFFSILKKNLYYFFIMLPSTKNIFFQNNKNLFRNVSFVIVDTHSSPMYYL